MTSYRLAAECSTCRCGEFDQETQTTTFDRDGEHWMQGHEEWCPKVATGVPLVPCPRCGARVDGYSYESGWVFKGLLGTIVPDVDDPTPYSEQAPNGWGEFVVEPRFSRLVLRPCRHILTGDGIKELAVAFAGAVKGEAHG